MALFSRRFHRLLATATVMGLLWLNALQLDVDPQTKIVLVWVSRAGTHPRTQPASKRRRAWLCWRRPWHTLGQAPDGAGGSPLARARAAAAGGVRPLWRLPARQAGDGRGLLQQLPRGGQLAAPGGQRQRLLQARRPLLPWSSQAAARLVCQEPRAPRQRQLQGWQLAAGSWLRRRRRVRRRAAAGRHARGCPGPACARPAVAAGQLGPQRWAVSRGPAPLAAGHPLGQS
jgi:hypothetical protein